MSAVSTTRLQKVAGTMASGGKEGLNSYLYLHHFCRRTFDKGVLVAAVFRRRMSRSALCVLLTDGCVSTCSHLSQQVTAYHTLAG